MTTNRRANPRFVLDVPIQLRVEGRTMVARTRDISLGGVCVVAPAPMLVDTELEIHIHPRDGREAESGLFFHATAIWCAELRTQYQIGARFAEMEPHRVTVLEHLIDWLRDSEQATPTQDFLERLANPHHAFDLSDVKD